MTRSWPGFGGFGAGVSGGSGATASGLLRRCRAHFWHGIALPAIWQRRFVHPQAALELCACVLFHVERAATWNVPRILVVKLRFRSPPSCGGTISPEVPSTTLFHVERAYCDHASALSPAAGALVETESVSAGSRCIRAGTLSRSQPGRFRVAANICDSGGLQFPDTFPDDPRRRPVRCRPAGGPEQDARSAPGPGNRVPAGRDRGFRRYKEVQRSVRGSPPPPPAAGPAVEAAPGQTVAGRVCLCVSVCLCACVFACVAGRGGFT